MVGVRIDMPALAGILKGLEAEPFVREYFGRQAAMARRRVKQALCVLVRLHM